MKKTCTRCKEVKNVKKFGKNRATDYTAVTTRRYYCRDCQREMREVAKRYDHTDFCADSRCVWHCTTCAQDKICTQFSNNPRKRSGLMDMCKDCEERYLVT